MGDVVMSLNWRSWPKALTYGLALSAILSGCAAGGGEAVSAPPPEVAAPVAAAAPAEAPVLVTGVTLREAAPGMRLDIKANGPAVWTTFRDAAGRLVLELPNAMAAPDVGSFSSDGGLVSAVTVETIEGAGRPLVRLSIETREEADHQTAREDNTVLVSLLPIGAVPAGAAPIGTATEVVASAPLAEEAEVRESERMDVAPALAATSEVAPAAVVGVPVRGTADAPTSGGGQGATATRLAAVTVDGEGDTVRVAISGNGSFTWKIFPLSGPERLVVDLEGVTNATSVSAVAGDGATVERVRVAQFQSEPRAVARVVVDLARAAEARVVEGPDGLELLFGGATSQAQQLAAVETEAVPEPMSAGPTEVDQVTVAQTFEEPAPVLTEPIRIEAERAPRPSAPTPAREVALFEALDVPQEESAPTTSRGAGAPNYAALEVGQVETKYTGEPINFALRDADIREVLRTFAKLSGLNVIVQPGVTGSVTVQFEQVPWDQALEQILKINGLWYELEGNIMRIAPRAVLNAEAQAEAERRKAIELSVPLRTIVKRVSYAQAGVVAGLLRTGGQGGLLSQRGNVTVDDRTNTLIIKELPSFMDSVLAIIEELDEPEPQVLIEARIVETTKRTSRSLGIRWGFDAEASPALGNTTGLDFPNNVASDGAVNLLTGGANGLINLTLGNVLDSFVLDATLQAAESEGLINILSTPKIATLNNERAEIQSGLQIPIQTVSNNTVTVQFVNATLRLAVTPQVTAEGTVLMSIEIQKREPQLAFAIAGAANAPIATKEARTRVIVRDGGTTVIGGIYEVSADQGQDRVPGLANIPFLGRLFKNNRRTDENEELLIFITPRVIKI